MPSKLIAAEIGRYAKETKDELQNILDYWISFSPDILNGGFAGAVNNENIVDFNAEKGSVLNSRILWSFSAAFLLTGDQQCLLMAGRAYSYIRKSFLDLQYGGVFWTVNAAAQPSDTKKQVYAQAFAIYALSEYYKTSEDNDALQLARDLYELLEERSFDKKYGGYFEAFRRDWTEIDDLRLSAKDANEKKTMNTHLHILEAYTCLYSIWEDEGLKYKIIGLLRNFLDHIIDPDTGHLILFMDEHWAKKTDTISYGHDIEASWLLLEAAEAVKDSDLLSETRHAALVLAEAAARGLAEDGSLYYEYEPSTTHMVNEKHWWVQAEAMVGFFNAWQLSGEERFLRISLNVWKYTKRQIVDNENGEWFWGRTGDGSVMAHEGKVGLWKCPYHNSRACMEIIKRAEKLNRIYE